MSLLTSEGRGSKSRKLITVIFVIIKADKAGRAVACKGYDGVV